jgi:ubiquinone/menaquinone biosynthesis C-methylase UbiE
MSISEFKSAAWAAKEAADRYHASTVAAPKVFYAVREDLYIRCIQRHAKPGDTILDLGCGSGLISTKLHDLGYKVVACDISQGMLDKLAEERGGRDFELRRGSGFEIPASDGEFDVVISRMFIQHFSEWQKVLREKARVVRTGGFVIFDFGNREHVDVCDPNLGVADGFPYCADPQNPGKFYAVASASEMGEQAKSAGLDVVEISPNGLLLYNGFIWKNLGADAIPGFNAELDRLLADPAARELLFLIEEKVLPLLPRSISYGNMTVLRRKEEPVAPPPRPIVLAGLIEKIKSFIR